MRGQQQATCVEHQTALLTFIFSSCRGSLGLTVTVVVNLALAAFNFYQRRQIEQQQRQAGCAHA